MNGVWREWFVRPLGTTFGARSIGLDRDLGSIEAGKLADLIVFDANPLADLRAILKPRYVMRNGFLFESETLDSVWPDWLPPLINGKQD